MPWGRIAWMSGTKKKQTVIKMLYQNKEQQEVTMKNIIGEA